MVHDAILGLKDALRDRGYCTSNYPGGDVHLHIKSVFYDFSLGVTFVNFTCDRHLEAQMLGVGKDTDLVLHDDGRQRSRGSATSCGSATGAALWAQRNETECRNLSRTASRWSPHGDAD